MATNAGDVFAFQPPTAKAPFEDVESLKPAAGEKPAEEGEDAPGGEELEEGGEEAPPAEDLGEDEGEEAPPAEDLNE